MASRPNQQNQPQQQNEPEKEGMMLSTLSRGTGILAGFGQYHSVVFNFFIHYLYDLSLTLIALMMVIIHQRPLGPRKTREFTSFCRTTATSREKYNKFKISPVLVVQLVFLF